MSKTKNKSHKRNEEERGYIRELESRVRQLEQELKQVRKWNQPQDTDERNYDSEDTYPDLKKKLQDCDECGKGKYEEFELLGKIFGTCNICGNRKRLK